MRRGQGCRHRLDPFPKRLRFCLQVGGSCFGQGCGVGGQACGEGCLAQREGEQVNVVKWSQEDPQPASPLEGQGIWRGQGTGVPLPSPQGEAGPGHMGELCAVAPQVAGEGCPVCGQEWTIESWGRGRGSEYKGALTVSLLSDTSLEGSGQRLD